ncbi:hypothetical protein G7Z17_g2920 [Cylindrodendrum hubeiense]|uniref:Bleomycin resistance protein n=1 Tax=Cylindrodendrum hubeiense TaxID=595255 RepID=A0A9P5HJY2_9HYPO|nr:hypothetical protein G7Z17_g2920 [Cylindrodendrum hubeiense]
MASPSNKLLGLNPTTHQNPVIAPNPSHDSDSDLLDIQKNYQPSSTTSTKLNSFEGSKLAEDSGPGVSPVEGLKPLGAASIKPDLVPELLVTNTLKSIEFWCDLCGFEINYQRVDEGFAYISRGTAHVMLEQRGIGRNWITATLDQPFGRGINFQISVPNLEPILLSLREADHPLFMLPETKWYRVSDTEETGVRQFLVADPDGYLIRFQSSVGRRPIILAAK